MNLEELRAKLGTFSPRQLEFVATVVESLSNPPQANILQHHTWLTSSASWMEYFGLALSVHHGATTEPLGTTAFETVFRNACRAADWSVESPASATRRFVDVVIRRTDASPQCLSLKSTAAQKLSERTAHISKLTEAAWVQDGRKPSDRRASMRELFQNYQEKVDAIVMLRGLRFATNWLRFQPPCLPRSRTLHSMCSEVTPLSSGAALMAKTSLQSPQTVPTPRSRYETSACPRASCMRNGSGTIQPDKISAIPPG